MVGTCLHLHLELGLGTLYFPSPCWMGPCARPALLSESHLNGTPCCNKKPVWQPRPQNQSQHSSTISSLALHKSTAPYPALELELCGLMGNFSHCLFQAAAEISVVLTAGFSHRSPVVRGQRGQQQMSSIFLHIETHYLELAKLLIKTIARGGWTLLNICSKNITYIQHI